MVFIIQIIALLRCQKIAVFNKWNICLFEHGFDSGQLFSITICDIVKNKSTFTIV